MSEVLTDGNDYVNATQTVVYARDGNDRVFTSLLSPDIYGGEGSDFIGTFTDGAGGDTEAYGGDGNDTLHGGEVSDEIYGDDGNDFLVGGEFDHADARTTGFVTLFGGDVGSGNDFLYGANGADGIYGL